jgi:hypothetical protein
VLTARASDDGKASAIVDPDGFVTVIELAQVTPPAVKGRINEGPIRGGNYQLTTAGHVQDIAGHS